jgi:single-strand DNA-binding protein
MEVPSTAITRTGESEMAGETTITVVGNLTADPELRFGPVSREFEISEGFDGENRSGGGG